MAFTSIFARIRARLFDLTDVTNTVAINYYDESGLFPGSCRIINNF